MSAAPSSLQAVLDRQKQASPPPVAEAARARRDNPAPSSVRPSREGRRLIAGHFDPQVARQLRMIAAEEDTTVQALLEEALNLLFVKKGQETINSV